MTKPIRPGQGLDVLLRQVRQDLQRLPRHEWDNYLWTLCNRLVQVDTGQEPRPPSRSGGVEHRED